MTIKEISIKKGITTQSVYKKIRRAGFEIDKLTTGKNGQLTSDAEDLLRELFGLPIEGDPAGEPGASDPGGQEIEPQSQGESKPGEGYNQGERVITQLRE